MKIAFISDIHGNAVALKAVLEDIEKRHVDEIIVLGDISFRGIEPAKSLKMVRHISEWVIKGNGDEWIVRGIEQGEVPDNMLSLLQQERDWAVQQLEESEMNYLKELPQSIKRDIEGVKIHAFHATPQSLFDVVFPYEKNEILQEKLKLDEADISIYGHIHQSFIRYVNGKCVMNIGSVGLPFDGEYKSSYGLIDVQQSNYQASIIRVNYDRDLVLKKISESDYPNKDFFRDYYSSGKQ
ncbi:metallophosphoesterase family protein [Cytobacillus horneckiae]|uniref:metallophosphoesterase family protein n=1 Tax=Cytobacillus horneckiae TaxID=549687 RepID=UPI003D9A42C4